ncbi:MAG TPA: asparagine synthase [Methanosarcinales archaeon]|nr:asparagine synthase [Methanosarcinales archaeon]
MVWHNDNHGSETESETKIAQMLMDRIRDSVRLCMHDCSGVAFSGGIDSSLIAFVAASMNPEIGLYAIGMRGSHDMKQAEKAATLLGLHDRLHLCECTPEDIKSALLPVMHATGSTNPVAVGIGLCMYFVSGCASKYGASVLLTGQGADELFAGYKRYEQVFDDGGLDRELERDMLALHDQVERDAAVARLNGVELRMPMLCSGVIDLAREIDAGLKIRRQDGYIRKYILRRASAGHLPAELAQAPKKAAQYGTGIQNVLRRMARRDGVTQGEFLAQTRSRNLRQSGFSAF